MFELRGFDPAYARRMFPGCVLEREDTRLATILASDPDPGRVDRARMGRRNPADTEPRPEVPPEDIEATRAEPTELRRRMTCKSA